ncbi:hypothetical protein Hanom_Chr12g01110221 [Helianthus anomalus]
MNRLCSYHSNLAHKRRWHSNLNRLCSYHSNLVHKRRWHSNLNLLPLPRASTLPDVTSRE